MINVIKHARHGATTNMQVIGLSAPRTISFIKSFTHGWTLSFTISLLTLCTLELSAKLKQTTQTKRTQAPQRHWMATKDWATTGVGKESSPYTWKASSTATTAGRQLAWTADRGSP